MSKVVTTDPIAIAEEALREVQEIADDAHLVSPEEGLAAVHKIWNVAYSALDRIKAAKEAQRG